MTMTRLTNALNAWGTAGFKNILKNEIEQMNAEELCLQQGLSASSYALDDNIKVMIINTSEKEGSIQAKIGIFYSGIIAGCSCADDPTPIDEQTEYCEAQVDINKVTADTTITILADTSEIISD